MNLVRNFIFGMLLLISACSSDYGNGPEAVQWLKNNNNPSALATNRFGETPNALKFVESIYEMGAVNVIVSGDSIMDSKDRIEKEGGPYADALVVTLPDETEARTKLIKVFDQEAKMQGLIFNPESDINGNKVFLWWD
jgi:hypothetical protein